MAEEVVYKPSEEIPKIFPGGKLEPPKFMPTFLEWLLRSGKQISSHKVSSLDSVTVDVYTVPNEFTLFITNAWISTVSDGTGTGGGSTFNSRFMIDSFDRDLLNVRLDKVVPGHSNLSASLSMPLKVVSGGKVQMRNADSVTTSTTVGFIGFLVKNSDILSF